MTLPAKPFAALCLALTLLVSGCGPRDPNAVRICVGSYNLNNLPFFIADAQGYFALEGLNVRTENFAQGGSKVLQALIARSSDVAVGFYDHTIQMQGKHKDVTAFVSLSRNSGLVMAKAVGSPFDPQRPETIRGLKIGITAAGSSSDFFVRYYLASHGIPSDAVALIGVGSGASAVAALQQRKVDLLVNYDPAATLIEESGAGTIVIDARQDSGAREVYGGRYPTSVMYALTDFIEERPDAATLVARALIRALHFIAESSVEEIVAALPDEYVSGDRSAYVKAIENTKPIFSIDGRFDADDLQTPLRVLSLINPDVAAKQIDLQRTYTNRFVDTAHVELYARDNGTVGGSIDSSHVE
jgi:NitT/TauT family transport system substrate-binding protein